MPDTRPTGAGPRATVYRIHGIRSTRLSGPLGHEYMGEGEELKKLSPVFGNYCFEQQDILISSARSMEPTPPSESPPPLGSVHTNTFAQMLHGLGASLAVTTYQ